MSKDTITWGPTARKHTPPHAFEASADLPQWCTHCGSIEDAYAHASAEERAAFDQARSPKPDEPITARELTRKLHLTLAVALRLDELRLGNITGVSGRRGYGEFTVTSPATGQRFRVTVTEMAEEA